MIKLYYAPSPNPNKVALFLEEAEADYEIVPIDTRKGEQFTPAFLTINPNAKTPALTDGDVAMFDSSAILLYLAGKLNVFGFAPDSPHYPEMLSWLMFIGTGIGPYSGQAVHFKTVAPEPNAYARHRYSFETERHWTIVEERLRTRDYMVGDTYTIVDMALWGWAKSLPFLFGEDAWSRYPAIKRLVDTISARPAARRASAIPEKFTFKRDMDDEARRNLFPHGSVPAAQV